MIATLLTVTRPAMRLSSISIAMLLMLSGCASTLKQENDAKVDDQDKAIQNLMATPQAAKIHNDGAPLDIAPLDPVKQQAIDRAWLRSKKVDFIPNKRNPAPIPALEILKMFRENGINITSALPLDNYSYNGNGVKAADGEIALQLILGQMGLDYETDDKGKYVTVIPMQSKSWNINLGNRTSYSSASSFENLCSMSGNNGSSQSPAQSGGSAMPGSTQGGMIGGYGVGQTSAMGQGTTSSTSGSNVQTQQNFWLMLQTELTMRLQVLIPVTGPAQNVMNAGNNTQQVPNFAGQPQMGGMPGAMQSSVSPGGSSLYTKQQIGHYAINPVTGNVTIQAPSWMLKQIGTYMDEIILPMFNTTMTFEGTIANVRSTSDKSTGFDLTALASYAGKFGIALNNNILGGVTFSKANGITSASYGNASQLPGSGAAFGIISPKDNLQIFNGFLTTLGGTEIVTKPIVTAASGVPVDFGRLIPIYTNEQTSTLAAGNVNSSPIATVQNNIVERKFGSLLRIMPHYDPKTRRIRAQISLLQRPLVGYQNLTLSLMGANGSITNQQIRIPQIECGVTSTEVILDDGELIIIGGQVENTTENSHSGVTGAMTIPGLDLVTSQRRDTGSRTTMYFALRVRLNSKPM